MSSVVEVRPIIQMAVRRLCQRPYPNHRHGCPNYGKKAGCPPQAPMFDAVYDLTEPVYAIVTEFDLAKHIALMWAAHPDWSNAQLRCCLYWQPKARSNLKAAIRDFLREHPGYRAEMCPEAMGVNVTRTLRNVGIVLEWPPERIVRQVALAAVPLEPETAGLE